MSCDVMWSHVMSGDVMLCQVRSCDVMWCHVKSCYVRWCHVNHVMSGDVMLCQVMSCDSHMGCVLVTTYRRGKYGQRRVGSKKTRLVRNFWNRNIPFSGKLSREKTSMNLKVLWLFTNLWSTNLGVTSLRQIKRAICKSFLSRKFPAIWYAETRQMYSN